MGDRGENFLVFVLSGSYPQQPRLALVEGSYNARSTAEFRRLMAIHQSLRFRVSSRRNNVDSVIGVVLSLTMGVTVASSISTRFSLLDWLTIA